MQLHAQPELAAQQRMVDDASGDVKVRAACLPHHKNNNHKKKQKKTNAERASLLSSPGLAD